MACFRPLKAYRAPGGQIVFDSKRGWSDRPLELACGQCIGCRVERSREWALRCVHEAQMHRCNSFITLTYNDEHLPANLSVDVKVWQKFAKRLRRRMGPFRFFHCGEYGESTLRPHYHALLFGMDFHQDRQLWRRKSSYNIYRSPILEEVWPFGHSEIGELTYQSAQYVARYVVSKVTGEQAEKAYERTNPETGETWKVRPPYVTMSRRPGIGTEWFEKFKEDVYPHDKVYADGKLFRPPRFYDEKLPEDELLARKAERLESISRRKSELTPERLKEREKYSSLMERARKRVI